jgi:flagellin-specific chaperone FliS
MKKEMILGLSLIILASLTIGGVNAQITVEVSQAVVHPGDTVIISGYGLSNTNILVEISNTRKIVNTLNVTTDADGQYSIKYIVERDAVIDSYRVKIVGETYVSSFIVSNMSPKLLTNSVRNIASIAKRSAETALIQMKKQGYTIPIEFEEKYREGLNSLVSADNAIKDNNFAFAHESIQDALNYFKEIIAYSYGNKNIEPPINKELVQNKVQDKINLLRRQYNEIKRAIYSLREYGLNAQILETDLNKLHEMIIDTQKLLDDGKIREADQSASRIQRIIREKLSTLRQRQAEITKKLAEKYQTSLENRVNTYIDTFEKIQTVRPIQSKIALTELEVLIDKLKESDSSLSNGNIVEAIRTMRVTEYRLKQLTRIVNGRITSMLLNRIDELTAYLEETPEPNINQLQDEIENAKDSLRDYLRKKSESGETNDSTISQTG